jgi:hypothetical protein
MTLDREEVFSELHGLWQAVYKDEGGRTRDNYSAGDINKSNL